MARAAMADAARTRDDLKEAVIQLEYGLTANAEMDNAYDLSRKQLFLVDIYRVSGNRTSLMKSLRDMPEQSNPELIFLLGRVYARSGRIGGADRELHRLEASTDRTPRVMSFSHMLESEIAVAKNRPMDAVRAATLANKLLNSPLAIETLARAYEVDGSREEAVHQYKLLLVRSMNVSLTVPTHPRCTQLPPPIIVWECFTNRSGATISPNKSSTLS
jgi:hypothetical protein